MYQFSTLVCRGESIFRLVLLLVILDVEEKSTGSKIKSEHYIIDQEQTHKFLVMIPSRIITFDIIDIIRSEQINRILIFKIDLLFERKEPIFEKNYVGMAECIKLT